jgi:ABC-type dipeptide/oligopeptide/nickel transport system permease component
LIGAVPLLLAITLIAFLIVHLIPGDPARVVAGPDADSATLELVRTNLGLDRALHEQYLIFLSRLTKAELGTSFQTRQPVLSEILERYPRSLLLAVSALIFAIIVGIPLGVAAALRHGGWVDAFASTLAVAGLSIPNFWLALLLIYFFSVQLKLFPTFGLESWKHLVLPAITLSTYSLALVTRMTRSSMIEALAQDYTRTARAKGLRPYVITFKHALKNGLIPTITVAGLSLGNLIGGAVIVETVFNIDGLGRLTLQSVMARDVPLVQGALLFIALNFVFANLVVDMLYSWVNPKIRFS